MIDAIGAISSIQPVGYIRQAIGAREAFHVPESPLRVETSSAAAITERDPVADAVDFSRDFPQLLMQSAFPPPVVDQSPDVLNRNAAGMDVDDPDGESTLNGESAVDAEEGEDGDVDEAAEPGEERGADGEKLDDAEQRQVRELKERDREVRAHEQAHMAAGGQYAGGMSYEYQQGPDGVRYAVGGEVSIDVSAERTPEATIAKMQQVTAAAMAPAEPSGQDHSVAAQARQTEAEARRELAAQRAEESGNGSGDGATESSSGADETESAPGAASPDSRPGNGGAANPFISLYSGGASAASRMASFASIDVVA